MSVYAVRPLDTSGVRTVALASRASKVSVRSFARRVGPGEGAILESLPDVLGGAALRSLSSAIIEAKRRKRPVLFGLGAHVFKVGLSPLLMQLLEEGFIDGVALNGAGIIHDFEIMACGATSEDVDASLPEGQFGVTRETAEVLNGAIARGAAEGLGIGEAVGRALAELASPHAKLGILAACYRRRIPVTVHVALGTDILHIHPSADGAATGASSLIDFRLFAALVAGLDGGGVYVNVGSAVVLPEVFLKAVTLVRNLGHSLEGFTTANLDFLPHYRPLTNVVRRPVAGHGTGLSLSGHHEILLPLLVAALLRDRESSAASER